MPHPQIFVRHELFQKGRWTARVARCTNTRDYPGADRQPHQMIFGTPWIIRRCEDDGVLGISGQRHNDRGRAVWVVGDCLAHRGINVCRQFCEHIAGCPRVAPCGGPHARVLRTCIMLEQRRRTVRILSNQSPYWRKRAGAGRVTSRLGAGWWEGRSSAAFRNVRPKFGAQRPADGLRRLVRSRGRATTGAVEKRRPGNRRKH